MSLRARAAAVIAALATLAVPAAASARTVHYVGKTSGGHKITFVRKGNKISKISTGIPTVCLSINRVSETQSGVELFQPEHAYRLGRTGKESSLQKPVMYYSDVTKNYTVKAKKAKHRRITGKLDLSFAFMIPTYPMPLTIDYACHGVTHFRAKAR
jgi:hypothetical protein